MLKRTIPKIQLLGSRECPNVEPTRRRLREVLLSEGLPPAFDEVDLDSDMTPARLRRWGSPTVLVDGEDVAADPQVTGAACRLYSASPIDGVPPSDLIRAAIQRARASKRSELLDLVHRPLGFWAWGIPSTAVLVGSFLDRTGHLVLWVPAFAIAGTACAVNAFRSRRVHCHITGPLLLLAAPATVFVGLDLIAVSFQTILSATVAVLLLSSAVEVLLRRKYFAAQCFGDTTQVMK
jgi:hypothetical protein